MNRDHYKAITERLDAIQGVVDRIDRDLAQDRHDLQEFAIRVGSLENQFKEMREAVYKLPQKTQDKVSEVMEPMRSETEDLRKTLDQKKVIIVKSKSLLKKLFRR